MLKHTNQKCLLLIALVLTVIFTVIYNISITSDTNFEHENTSSEEEDNITKYVYDHWQFIGDKSKLFGVYSAYFDERLEMYANYKCPFSYICYGTVRIVALLPYTRLDQKKLFCNYKYSDGIVRKVNVTKTEVVWDDRSHLTFVTICVLTQSIHEKWNPPEAVGLTYEKEVSMVNPTVFTYIRYPSVLNSKVQSSDKNDEIAACIPGFHDGYSNALRIAEFIELHKILGVTKFYFYNNSMSEEVTQLFNYYLKNENIELLDWNVEDYHGWAHIYDFGLSACFNDCYFRASFLDNFKYVLLTDIDEFIFPEMKNVTTLTELVKKLDTNERFNSFNVKSSFVKLDFTDNLVDKKSKTFTNKLLYTQNNIQIAPSMPHHARSKMIGKGKYLNLLSNHFALITAINTIERRVESNEALLFHYREKRLTKSFPIKDTVALKYENQLRKKVDDVCSKVFVDKVCPFGK